MDAGMSIEVGTSQARIVPAGGTLPELSLAAWHPTKDTVHLWAQIVGKVKLALTPLRNQWWNVPLYLDARGLTTRILRHGERSFRLDFDFVGHRLVLVTDRSESVGFELVDGLSVATFYERLMGLLTDAGLEVRIRPAPFGVPMTTPFSEDTEHASYDAEAVGRYWHALTWSYWVFEGFAGWFSGKASPVQVYWHSFDLAYTRFSGRAAPSAPEADSVSREAYDEEVISFGFWPGDRNTPFPAFYSYTAPEPERLTDRTLAPSAAVWAPANGGHLAVLAYDEVRASADPQLALLGFLESAYQAGAAAADWPVDRFRSNWCPRPGDLVVLRGH
jgi:hypothetical protein